MENKYKLYEVPPMDWDEIDWEENVVGQVREVAVNVVESNDLPSLMGRMVSGINNEELSDQNYWMVVEEGEFETILYK
jgi:hypothetical protein